MRRNKKWLLCTPILLAPTLISTPIIEAHADVTIKKPNLHINEKGKVDVLNSKGKVTSKATNVNNFIKKYRFVIAGISGIGAMSMILFFILNFMKLGAYSANPNERARIVTGLVFSGVAAAGLGAVTLITGLFYNTFK